MSDRHLMTHADLDRADSHDRPTAWFECIDIAPAHATFRAHPTALPESLRAAHDPGVDPR